MEMNVSDVLPRVSAATNLLVNGTAVDSKIDSSLDKGLLRVVLEKGKGYEFSYRDIGNKGPNNPLDIYSSYLRLYDESGKLVAQNQNVDSFNSFSAKYSAENSGNYYLEIGSVYVFWDPIEYSISAKTTTSLPIYNNEQIANYLSNGYWNDIGFRPHKFNADLITYNMEGLSAEGQRLAYAAMAAWSEVTGIRAASTNRAAMITFDDNNDGAVTNVAVSGSSTVSATINIGTSWLQKHGTSFNSYSYQTYLHEVGHALGLGHAGNYDGNATWGASGGQSNHYANDSWQATVMSYFDQDENNTVNASKAFSLTPMIADIIAIRNMYGTSTRVNEGDTTHDGRFTSIFTWGLADGSNRNAAYTIFDTGGSDTIDVSSFFYSQRIDLRPGHYSDVDGGIGNVGIDVNTIIENVKSGAWDDFIYGNNADNIIDGGYGADDMRGGLGDDIYYVTFADIEDIRPLVPEGTPIIVYPDFVYENANEGTDTIIASTSYEIMTEQHIEFIRTTDENGSKAINFTGNSFDQTLTGNAGKNTLNGKGGVDNLHGLGGNDLYYVDNAGDQLFEAANGGADTVATSVSYALAAGREIEALQTTRSAGMGAINLTGNEFAQTITGNAGANSINGRGGADTMRGVGGNDTYYVDNAGDRVIEAAGGGTDTVGTNISYTLTAGQEIEKLVTTSAAGTAALNLTGNAFAQTIRGNAGANTINGGAGLDTLTGGAGADTFVFNTTLGSTNIDSITDFNPVADTIHLENAIFAKLVTAGSLNAAYFKANTTGMATDGNDYIVYESDTGKLFYDADGSGSGGTVQFAVLNNNVSLTASHFLVG